MLGKGESLWTLIVWDLRSESRSVTQKLWGAEGASHSTVVGRPCLSTCHARSESTSLLITENSSRDLQRLPPCLPWPVSPVSFPTLPHIPVLSRWCSAPRSPGSGSLTWCLCSCWVLFLEGCPSTRGLEEQVQATVPVPPVSPSLPTLWDPIPLSSLGTEFLNNLFNFPIFPHHTWSSLRVL